MNNLDFIQFALDKVNHPYIFGTYGLPLTEGILENVNKMYPEYMNSQRVEIAKKNYLGITTYDCSGLFKGYCMQAVNNGVVKYNSKYDLNVKGLFESSKNKKVIDFLSSADLFKSFKTSIGLACCNSKFTHIIYITNELKNNTNELQTVESKGFDYGVVTNKYVNQVNMKYIFELPFIEYKNGENNLKSFTENKKAFRPFFTSEEIQEIALDVISGVYGNGDIRKAKLKEINISYDMIQARVNNILANRKIKTDAEIAKEVITGVYGTSYQLQQTLTYMGYDYKYIDYIVGRMKK